MMNKSGLIFLCIVFSGMLCFAASEKVIESKIGDVTVFLRGAQINRTAVVNLSSGVHIVKLKGLSADIDPNSIEVSGQGNFTILSVSHQMNYLNEGSVTDRVKQLNDSLELLKYDLDKNKKLDAVLKSEWDLIISNKNVNNNAGFDIEDLDDLATYYRERLSEIVDGQIALKKEETELNQLISRLKRQLQEENANSAKTTSEILVELKAETTIKGKLEVGYYVRNAGWVPTYDLRVKDSNSPINLSYKAKVFQNSGVDWENVNLTLSTGNPTRGGTKPTFYPWRLDFMQDQLYYQERSKGYGINKAASAPVMFDADEEVMEAAQTVADYTKSVENTVNSSFQIGIPKSIHTDGKYHTIDIQSYQLKAEYKYFAAPKLDNDVFLVGRISGWEDYNLMSGNATIFYDGTYTGKSFLDAGKSADTLELSLGRDNGIIVNRTKIKDFTKNQVIGASKKETVGWAISIRNTKNIPVRINLMDQLPISSNQDIQVEILEVSGAKHDPQTGYLNWDVSIEPAEMLNYVIKYSVKYPKHKKVNL